MAEYYYLESDKQVGPVSKGDLRALLEKGAVTPQTPVFRTGDKEWQTAHYYQELAVDRKMAPPSRATSPKATPPRSLPPENDSAPLPDLQRSHIARAIIIIGVLIAGFFLLFYDTNVKTETAWVSGVKVGGTEVNNIGLMLNRLLGSIVGMVTIVVGVILLVTDTKKPSK
ncbi:MAG: DUF4339 domain-containing protein [Verrucomicrobiota bacterium]